MISLGVDPSLTGFGWCVHCSTALGLKRILDSGVFGTAKAEGFVARNANLRAILTAILSKYPEIEAVGVESPPYGEQFSEGLYALFVYVNEAIYLCRRNVVYFDPKTVKMLAKMDPSVRRGTMDKSDMIEAAKAEVGKVLNHNIADAYIIARSAARFWELESGIISADELTPSETHSFRRVHTFERGERAGQTVRGGLIYRENDRFFRFSAKPFDPEEEELRTWLVQKGLKILEEAKGVNPRKRPPIARRKS